MIENKKKTEKGAALIIAVILCSVLLLIAATLSTAAVSESQSSIRIDSSTSAYNNAQAGLNWALFYINQGQANTSSNITYDFGTCSGSKISCFMVTIYAPDSSGNRLIDSTGNVSGIKRKIEYTLTSYASSRQPCAGTTYTMTPLANSFTWQFDLSLVTTTNPTTVSIADDSATPNTINVQYTDPGGTPTFNLGLNNGNYPSTPIQVTNAKFSDMTLLQAQSEFRATITYVPNVAVEMQISYRDSGLVIHCLGTTWVSMVGTGISFGSFSKVSMTDASAICQTSAGDTYSLNGTNFAVTNMVLEPYTN